MKPIGVPQTIHGSFQGAAKIFQESLASEPFLILAAFATIYISLGMLYESFVHPLTILSTLPSAGVGAVLALLLFRHRIRHHRNDRGDPADRHRQEERHHDDRLRARCRASARHVAGRCDPRSLPAAIPADHDDHHASLLGAVR